MASSDEHHAVYRQDRVITIKDVKREIEEGRSRGDIVAGGLFCSHLSEMTFVIGKKKNKNGEARATHFRHLRKPDPLKVDDRDPLGNGNLTDAPCGCSSRHLTAQVLLRDLDYSKYEVRFTEWRDCKNPACCKTVYRSSSWSGRLTRAELEVREACGKFVSDVVFYNGKATEPAWRAEVWASHRTDHARRAGYDHGEVKAEHVIESFERVMRKPFNYRQTFRVDFRDKDKAKALGAEWDGNKNTWFTRTEKARVALQKAGFQHTGHTPLPRITLRCEGSATEQYDVCEHCAEQKRKHKQEQLAEQERKRAEDAERREQQRVQEERWRAVRVEKEQRRADERAKERERQRVEEEQRRAEEEKEEQERQRVEEEQRRAEEEKKRLEDEERAQARKRSEALQADRDVKAKSMQVECTSGVWIAGTNAVGMSQDDIDKARAARLARKAESKQTSREKRKRGK
jgi:hypothetical protein